MTTYMYSKSGESLDSEIWENFITCKFITREQLGMILSIKYESNPFCKPFFILEQDSIVRSVAQKSRV